MSGYSAGEAAILAKVQGATGFDATNTARGDWKPLNKGLSDHYAILRQGPFEIAANSLGGGVRTVWTTVIEVWTRYVDDAETRTDLYGYSAAVMAELWKWAHLGGPAEDMNITGGAEPREMWKEGGNGPAWLMQELTVSWAEVSTVTFSE